jgi:type II secretory pathway pseudopilin PulG
MMSQHQNKRQAGVSWVEVTLVLVIISAVVVMGMVFMKHYSTNMRIDKTAVQMQQILNDSMAYYVTNGTWPEDISTLTAAHFFSSDPVSPWADQPYYISQDAKKEKLYVWTEISIKKPGVAISYANDIASQLPFGYMSAGDGSTPPTETACSGTVCTVVAYVTIPQQNQNNAGMNFGGLYHHGSCVPVPQCPADATGIPIVPSVYMVPASVSGSSDAATAASDNYQMSNFTGYAMGGNDTSPPECEGDAPDTQQDCSQLTNAPPSQRYWRACASFISTDGANGNSSGAQYVTLMALTRCAGANQ